VGPGEGGTLEGRRGGQSTLIWQIGWPCAGNANVYFQVRIIDSLQPAAAVLAFKW
jgi:hypothetical protein